MHTREFAAGLRERAMLTLRSLHRVSVNVVPLRLRAWRFGVLLPIRVADRRNRTNHGQTYKTVVRVCVSIIAIIATSVYKQPPTTNPIITMQLAIAPASLPVRARPASRHRLSVRIHAVNAPVRPSKAVHVLDAGYSVIQQLDGQTPIRTFVRGCVTHTHHNDSPKPYHHAPRRLAHALSHPLPPLFQRPAAAAVHLALRSPKHDARPGAFSYT